MSQDRNRATSEETDIAVAARHQTKQPRRFAVVLYNDDYTTMEFVVMVLVRYFGKSETEAHHVMLEVHHRGTGLAGIYTRDVAESKAEQVEELARSEGHPLRCTTEPLDGDADRQSRA